MVLLENISMVLLDINSKLPILNCPILTVLKHQHKRIKEGKLEGEFTNGIKEEGKTKKIKEKNE